MCIATFIQIGLFVFPLTLHVMAYRRSRATAAARSENENENESNLGVPDLHVGPVAADHELESSSIDKVSNTENNV